MAERDYPEHFDQRLVEFYIRSGTVTKKDYEQYLKKLPNSEANADYIEPFEEKPAASEDTPSSELTFTAAESDT